MATFVVVEGVSSLVLLAYHATRTQRPLLAEETSTTYDPEIGWIAKKSFRAVDMFGPGLSLHTNARGFRGTEEIEEGIPPGKQRLICSGDSFTLGYGVGDDETWCAQLATPVLQTVNMGQGAYGIDQAYLWYRRDGLSLAHNVHLFAFITDDFRRMDSDRFLGFAKPKLAIQDDSLVVLGVPVPPRPRNSWRTRLVPAVQTLHSAQLVAHLTSRATPQGSQKKKPPRKQDDDLSAVVSMVVADLAEMNAAKNSKLVLVYLPVDTDFQNEASAEWRHRMRVIADSLQVSLIDLTVAQRKLGRKEMQQLYISKTELALKAAKGHFSVDGNRWAASQISAGLDSILGATSRGVTKRR